MRLARSHEAIRPAWSRTPPVSPTLAIAADGVFRTHSGQRPVFRRLRQRQPTQKVPEVVRQGEYPTGFGYEFNFGEQVTLSQDARTVSLFCTADIGIDNLRIVTAIPEPASFALLGIGGLLMLGRRRA